MCKIEMKSNYKIYPNVKKGKNFKAESFSIIGLLPKVNLDKDTTIIGNNAFIRSHSVLYAGSVIGDNFFCGHGVTIRECSSIGNNVSIGTGSIIEHHVCIKDNVRLHSRVFVPEFSIIEEEAWLGPNVVLTNAFHPLCPKVKQCLKGPLIKRKAKIGANVTILPHVTIGENSLIGAGSVVVNDIPANSVAFGNPAKIRKKIKDLRCHFGRIDKPY